VGDDKTLNIRVAFQDNGAAAAPAQPPTPANPPAPPQAAPQASAVPNGAPQAGPQTPAQGPQTPAQPIAPPVGPPQRNQAGPAQGATGAVAGEAVGGIALPAAPEVPAGAGGGALEMLGGPFLIALGAATLALGTLEASVGALKGALDPLANSLKMVNADVGMASAQQQAANFASKFEQGQQIGGDIAGFVNQETGLEVTLRDIETNLISTFAPLIKLGLGLLQLMADALDLVAKLLSAISRLIQYGFHEALAAAESIKGIGPLIKKLADWVDENLFRDPRIDKWNDIQKDIMDALDPHRFEVDRNENVTDRLRNTGVRQRSMRNP
jgi:hypothetical protein